MRAFHAARVRRSAANEGTTQWLLISKKAQPNQGWITL